MSKQQALKMNLRDRDCELCGSRNFTPLWSRDFQAATRNHQIVWPLRLVVCRDCGFTFTSPVPTEEAISAYYGDSFLHLAGQARDYSIEARHSFIRSLKPGRNGTFVEIGSNNSDFSQTMAPHFDRVFNVEINDGAAGAVNLDVLEKTSADVVAAYFVLEHVPQVSSFLSSCNSIMQPNGVLIIEVPDIELYPRDPAGLMFFEHVNHFSQRTLASLASVVGLKLVSASHSQCSRSFGFVAAFMKSEVRKSTPDPNEHAISVSSIRGGLDRIGELDSFLNQCRKRIAQLSASGQGVVIWAANEFSRQLLAPMPSVEGLIVVDMDPKKRNFLAPVLVRHPMDCRDKIAAATAIFVCTPTHGAAISTWISENCESNAARKIEILAFP